MSSLKWIFALLHLVAIKLSLVIKQHYMALLKQFISCVCIVVATLRNFTQSNDICLCPCCSWLHCQYTKNPYCITINSNCTYVYGLYVLYRIFTAFMYPLRSWKKQGIKPCLYLINIFSCVKFRWNSSTRHYWSFSK